MSEGKTYSHINNNVFTLFEHDLLSADEKLDMLEHIEKCGDCKSSYLSFAEQMITIAPSADLPEQIMAGIREQRRLKALQNRRSTIFQYIKLAVAVCLTLVMFWGGSFIFNMSGGTNLLSAASIPSEQQIQRAPETQKPQKIKASTEPYRNFISDFMDSYSLWFDKMAFDFNIGNHERGK